MVHKSAHIGYVSGLVTLVPLGIATVSQFDVQLAHYSVTIDLELVVVMVCCGALSSSSSFVTEKNVGGSKGSMGKPIVVQEFQGSEELLQDVTNLLYTQPEIGS